MAEKQACAPVDHATGMQRLGKLSQDMVPTLLNQLETEFCRNTESKFGTLTNYIDARLRVLGNSIRGEVAIVQNQQRRRQCRQLIMQWLAIAGVIIGAILKQWLS